MHYDRLFHERWYISAIIMHIFKMKEWEWKSYMSDFLFFFANTDACLYVHIHHMHADSRLWLRTTSIYPSIHLFSICRGKSLLVVMHFSSLILPMTDRQVDSLLSFAYGAVDSILASGDSQTVIPKLVCFSLGLGVAHQELWRGEKDIFKLYPSQSTGGAHESATSRRFPQSWAGLLIDIDSTPLTFETPNRASPIKSFLWFFLLIINVSAHRGDGNGYVPEKF